MTHEGMAHAGTSQGSSGSYVIAATVLLAALILSGTIYFSSTNLQKAIEGVKVGGSAGSGGAGTTNPVSGITVVSDTILKANAEKYISDNFLASGYTAEVASIQAYDDYLVTATLNVKQGASVVDTANIFISKDGKSIIIGNEYKLNESIKKTPSGSDTAAAAPAEVPKVDKPTATAYVMSFCPYGFQFLKAYIPVMEALKGKADLKVGLVPYVLHGAKEVEGNGYIYCAQKDYPEKFTAYLRCAVENGNYTSCLASNGMDATKEAACVADLHKQFNITGSSSQYPVEAVEAGKYGVQGSPTFVLNGVPMTDGNEIWPRSAANVLKAVCAGFTNPPPECNLTLSDVAEAAGAGKLGTASAATGTAAAGCG